MELIKMKWLLVFLVCLQCLNTINGLTCCRSSDYLGSTGSPQDGGCESTCEATGPNPVCLSAKITTKAQNRESKGYVKSCNSPNPIVSLSCKPVQPLLTADVDITAIGCECNHKDKCNQFHASAERLTPLVGTIIGLATILNFFLVHSY